MPQKTIIRPAHGQTQRVQPQKVPPKSNMARTNVKVMQVPMQRQPQVKQEIRVGHRNQMNLNQKTRIYIPSTERGYQVVSNGTHTNPTTVYQTQSGKVTSPGRYDTPDRGSVNTEMQKIVPKDERLSPDSSEVISAWEQSIKDPSPGSITFNNGRVQIHRAPVSTQEMEVKSPQGTVHSPQNPAKSPQVVIKTSPKHQVKAPQVTLVSNNGTGVTKIMKSPQNGNRMGSRIEVARIPVIKQVNI